MAYYVTQKYVPSSVSGSRSKSSSQQSRPQKCSAFVGKLPSATHMYFTGIVTLMEKKKRALQVFSRLSQNYTCQILIFFKCN